MSCHLYVFSDVLLDKVFEGKPFHIDCSDMASHQGVFFDML